MTKEITNNRSEKDDSKESSYAYALEASEQRFSALFRESSDPILLSSKTGGILCVNPSFEKLTGLESGALFSGSEGWSNFLLKHDQEALLKNLIKAAEDDQALNTECKIISAGGVSNWYDVSTNPLHSETGEVKGLMCIARNIDLRKLKELKLLEETKELTQKHQRAQNLISRLKKLLNSIAALPDDTKDFLSGVSELLSEMYPACAISIKSYEDVDRIHSVKVDPKESVVPLGPEHPMLHKKLVDSHSPILCNSLKDTPPYCNDTSLERIGVNSFVGAPILDSDEQLRGTLVLISLEPHFFQADDVEVISVLAMLLAGRLRAQKQKMREQSLKTSLQQSQRMEALGKLAGGVSHEFNNILGGILGISSYLISKMDEETSLKDDLMMIQKAAENAKDVTGQLLTFSKRRFIEKKPVDINMVLENMLKLSRHSISSKINLDIELESSQTLVNGDEGQLSQVFTNLIINAAQAMGDDYGTLSVLSSRRKLDADEKLLLENPVFSEHDFIHITISDTGAGVSESIKEHIFEPFYTTKEEGKGSGLGLSIVYGIVINHGGCITVDSCEGEGASFNVLLPVHVKK